MLIDFSLSPSDVMGLSGTFFTYGVIAVAAVVFIYILLPETKGKALQDIDRELCERRSDRVYNSLNFFSVLKNPPVFGTNLEKHI